MIRLIITASDELYSRLSAKVRAEGDIPRRAVNVVDGFEQAMALGEGSMGHTVSAIIVDMSLHAADTLVETLHSRRITAHIPLLAANCDKRQIPLSLRRLCTEVLEADAEAHTERGDTGVGPHSVGGSTDAL